MKARRFTPSAVGSELAKAALVLQSAVFLAFAASVSAQAPFQNLGFESANLNPIPAAQFGGPVPISAALPGWTGYLGNNQVTQVLQNNLTLGDASIDILGPNWTGNPIIEGQYEVVLQPGVDPAGSGQMVNASISQIGLVPANTQSLEFKAVTSTAFSVSLGGQPLSIIQLGTAPNYTLYGANVPASDDGMSEALTITAVGNLGDPDYFDSFAFSSSQVPEPNTDALAAIGALLFALYYRSRSTRLPDLTPCP